MEVAWFLQKPTVAKKAERTPLPNQQRLLAVEG